MIFAVPLLAQQSTGELRLSVKDATGAGIPAAVDLVNQSTETHIAVQLASGGRYIFKNLPYGFYRLQIAQTGFVSHSELVEIRSALPVSREVTLGIQPVESAVQVTESATLLDPNRVGTAYYAGSREIEERKQGTPGRGLIDLVAAQPGWLLEANGVLHPRESEYETQYVVDGFPVQDNRSPSFAPSMEADDVQSVKAYTSGIPAEFGRKLGGVVEVNTTRNTSPGFHGTASVDGGSFDTVGGFLSAQYTAGPHYRQCQRQRFFDRSLPRPSGSLEFYEPRIEHLVHRNARARPERRRPRALLRQPQRNLVPGTERADPAGCRTAPGP